MRAQRSGESALLLLDAIDLLKRENVPYAVVGAMAASVYGVVRASMDADAVLSFSRVLEVPFRGEQLRIIGREDFVAMKLFAQGPQDITDAELAVAAAGRDLDLPLVRRLASQYGGETVSALEKILTARR